MKRAWFFTLLLAVTLVIPVPPIDLPADVLALDDVNDFPTAEQLRAQRQVAQAEQPKLRETDWSKKIAADFRAQGIPAETEFVCPDGSRVDVLTPEFATEVEWSAKWKESIGQALFYGVATNRQPMVILLVSKTDDKANYLRCAVACAKAGIRLEVRSVD